MRVGGASVRSWGLGRAILFRVRGPTRTIRIHFRHLVATLGQGFPIGTLTRQHLQAHVNRRSAVVGRGGRKESADTAKKELATLRACWNWAEPDFVTGKFPNKHLELPKKVERPPFRTRAEIERQIADGGLVGPEADGLWDGLFLTHPEIDELLSHDKEAERCRGCTRWWHSSPSPGPAGRS